MKYISLIFTMAVMICLFAQIVISQPNPDIRTGEVKQHYSLKQWTYIQVDDSRGKWGDWDKPAFLKYFGLAMMDITDDGYLDIASGRYAYLNPGGDMTGDWKRVDLGSNVDSILMMNVDNDDNGDIIAQALPDVYWIEAQDETGENWRFQKIADVPATDHVNSQGFELGQIVPGGKPEVIIATNEGTFSIEVPENPQEDQWPKTRIATGTASEGLAVADVDRDGDMDLLAGNYDEYLAWWQNPNDGSGNWQKHIIGHTPHDADRVEAGDINGDGKVDMVASEERYPGPEPDAYLFWYEQPEDPTQEWTRHEVTQTYSLNNLDIADMDNDGDMDIITNEHKGPDLKALIFVNDGYGQFEEVIVDTGKESHLGSQVADMDGDGDYDIVSIGWDQHNLLHLWRNDAIK